MTIWIKLQSNEKREWTNGIMQSMTSPFHSALLYDLCPSVASVRVRISGRIKVRIFSLMGEP